MPKAATAEPDTRGETDENARVRTGNLPQNFVQRLGLPPLRGPRLKFGEFIAWWAAIPADKQKNITVYTYVLIPVLNFPDREHYIDVIPGETPLRTEEEVLNRYGLGDFHFKMKYAGDNV